MSIDFEALKTLANTITLATEPPSRSERAAWWVAGFVYRCYYTLFWLVLILIVPAYYAARDAWYNIKWKVSDE